MRTIMCEAGLVVLPEDILYLVAEACLGQNDGFRRWCELARAFPRLSSMSLPRAPLKQLTRPDLPWEGICRQINIPETETNCAEAC